MVVLVAKVKHSEAVRPSTALFLHRILEEGEAFLSLRVPDLQFVHFLIEFFKKMKHSEPGSSRSPIDHCLNRILPESEAI